VGIFAGVFSGATVADRLGQWLNGFAAIAPHGETMGIAVTVAGITYLSLILGELVPKRIALLHPEPVAAFVARPMIGLSLLAAPAVWVLKISSRLLVCDGQVDRPIGVIHSKDLLPVALRCEEVHLKALMMPALCVPEGISVLKLVELFKREKLRVAVVVDEHGSTEGLITLMAGGSTRSWSNWTPQANRRQRSRRRFPGWVTRRAADSPGIRLLLNREWRRATTSTVGLFSPFCSTFICWAFSCSLSRSFLVSGIVITSFRSSSSFIPPRPVACMMG
jgi:CBS domain-containing protein